MGTALRVLHINSESGYSGGEHQVFLLMRYLRDLGVDNQLTAPPGSRSEAVADDFGFDFHPAAMRNYTDMGAVGRLIRVARETQPDIVHLHTGRATWLGGMAAWRSKLPSISTRRMDRRVKPGLRTRLIYSKFVQRAVAIAPAVADLLIEGGVPPERTCVIWDAVEPEDLRGSTARDRLRAELGATPDDVVLLTMAALHRGKGIDVLVAALALCADQGLRPKVWIGGIGEQREPLEAQVRELGVDVTFLGWRDDVRDLLAAVDGFVLPSRREGVGVAALEAMAAGKAVVASAVGGLGQAMVHEESGLLVPPEDIEALSGAILRIGRDPALRKQLGEGAARRTDELYAASHQALAYRDLYDEVIAEYRAR